MVHIIKPCYLWRKASINPKLFVSKLLMSLNCCLVFLLAKNVVALLSNYVDCKVF